MKTKLFVYTLPLLLLVMLFYGYSVQDHPTNKVQSSTKIILPANEEYVPVINTSSSTCSYAWVNQTSATTTSQLFTVSAVSSKVCWAGGAGATAATGTVIKTTDGGITWANVATATINGSVYNIFALDDVTAFCTTTPSTTTFIFKTTDGGVSWTSVFSQAGGFIDAIEMVSPTEGYALGDPVGGRWTLLKTTTGGGAGSWVQMATAPVNGTGEAGWNNSFLIVGSDMWFGTNVTRAWHSTDLGLTWTSPATTGTLNTYAIHFNSTGASGLGLTGGNAMVKSVDGGASYSATLAPGTTGNLDGLEGYGSDFWGIRSNAVIYKTTDQGATAWTTDYTQTGAVFQDIDLTLDGDCPAGWAVGNGGNIAKMEPSGGTKRLKLFACIEGYWNCTSYIGDTLTICIRATTAGFPIIAIAKGKCDEFGNLTVTFKEPISNTDPYYIVVKHRNALETWSKAGGEVWGAGTTLTYNFTTAASQAYGNNIVFKCGKYCIFSGDVNQDGAVDLADLTLIDNDSYNFVSGYVVTDLNCDGTVDLTDAAIADNNAFNFVVKITP